MQLEEFADIQAATGATGPEKGGSDSSPAKIGSATGMAHAATGPASVVTHVIKEGDRTVVSTTTFHNSEDKEAALWRKVKAMEENKCDGCSGSEGANSGAEGGNDLDGSRETAAG